MKSVLIIHIMILFSSLMQSQTRFEAAKKVALEKNKMILLNFSGSDWCVPCIKFKTNIIETEVFKQLTKDSIIEYINADFPRNKKNQPAPEMKKENSVLADQYNPNGIFPFTVLLDSQGNILKTWEGLPDATATSFAKEIRTYYKKIK